jgi:hypothetical protein
MDIKILFVVFLLLVVGILAYVSYDFKFENFILTPTYKLSSVSAEQLRSPNFPEKNLMGFPTDSRPQVWQILDDPTFQDVVVYPNDDDPYADGQTSGIDKCLSKCNGKCVEFGVSGIGFCYPSYN